MKRHREISRKPHGKVDADLQPGRQSIKSIHNRRARAADAYNHSSHRLRDKIVRYGFQKCFSGNQHAGNARKNKADASPGNAKKQIAKNPAHHIYTPNRALNSCR